MARAVSFAATIAAFASACVGSTSTPAGQVVTYPAPRGQALSSDYAVEVRPVDGAWQNLDVYKAIVGLDTYSNSAMVEFDLRGAVEVSITKTSGTMHSTLVRPLSYGITPPISADGKTATFTLSRPLNVSFEPDGDRRHNLQVFANPIENDIPRPGPGVIFFAPGVYTIPGDHVLRVPSNTTVYIAAGAVVQGSLTISNARNVVVRGRGVIDPSAYFAPGSRATVQVEHSSNIGIRDITLIRAQDGGFKVTDSNGVVIANAREINADRWSDGVDVVSSTNVLIDSVFLRTSDDSIAVYGSTPWGGHGGTRNVTVRNSTLWADAAHPILVGTHGNPARHDVIQHVDFQNIDILEHNEYRGGDLYQGTMALNAGNAVIARDIRFEDIRVEDFTLGQLVNVRVFLNPNYNKRPGTSVDHVLFRNISYRGDGDKGSQIEGYDSSRQVTNVTFENLNYNGTTVLDPSAGNIDVGPYASNVTFRAQPPATSFNDASRAIHYSGKWLHRAAEGSYGGDVHSTTRAGSHATFAFTGQQARVYGQTGPGRGEVDVFLDGAYVTTVDTYSRLPRIQQIWFDTGILATRRHRLELSHRGANILATGAAIGFDEVEIVR